MAALERLKVAAVQLVAQHLDASSAMREACEPVADSGEGQCRAADAAQLMFPQEASALSPSAALATEGLWSAVAGCWEEGDMSHLLSPSQRSRLVGVLQASASLLDSLLFLPRLFLQLMTEQLPQIPLEVVCSLECGSLLSLEAWLEESPAVADYLVSAVVSASCMEARHEGQDTVLQAVAQTLSELVQRKFPQAVRLVQQLGSVLLAHPRPASYSLVRAAMACPSLPSPAASELCSVLLTSCLARPATSLLEVVPRQAQWRYSCLPDPAISLYSDLAECLGPTHLIQLLQKAMSVEELNWAAVLQVVSCFLHSSDSAPHKMSDLVQGLVSGAVEEGDAHLLTCGLLLARQASLEGTHIFPSYQHWFQTSFGESAGGVAGGKKQLLFLLKTLTRLAPHDPAFALKAHISQLPRRQAKCLSQLSDYVLLASTRLQDLGEKVPTAGGEEVQSDVSRDVKEAVAYFSQHNRISQQVKEASIFRRPYFVGRFLPSLLSPCPWPSPEGIGGLIAALDSEKKIPQKMLRNYEKACQELRTGGSPLTSRSPLPVGGVACVLRDLPSVVMEGRAVTKLLSRLSAALQEECSEPLSSSALQVVDVVVSGVCETAVLQAGRADVSYRWLGELLAMLRAHTVLHQPLHLRLRELLSLQLPSLTRSQLLGLAVLLCQVLCLPPAMTTVKDSQSSLELGEEYCVSLLSNLRHDTPTCMAQCLRFGCMFVQHLVSCDSSGHPVPPCLLHKASHLPSFCLPFPTFCMPVSVCVCIVSAHQQMVYIYRREKFLQTHAYTKQPPPPTHIEKVVQALEALLLECQSFADQWHSCQSELQPPPPTHIEKVVQAVEALLLECQSFADQWHSCQVNFAEWLRWEVQLDPSLDAMSWHYRRSYHRSVVFGDYLQICSAQELFIASFKTLASSRSSPGRAEALSLLQELCQLLQEQEQDEPSALLRALQDLLCTSQATGSREKALECMILASSLPPRLLFASCQGQPVRMQLVAHFIRTLAPLVEERMTLPPHVTLYLTLGVVTVSKDALDQLSDMSPVYLASFMAHWPLLTSMAPANARVAAVASWIHSDMQGPLPSHLSPSLLAPLAVALWHYFAGQSSTDVNISHQLTCVPAQVVVLVAACCVHWLAVHTAWSPDPQHSTAEAVLHACLQQEPSAVEVLHAELQLAESDQSPACAAEPVLRHSELLSSFRVAFSCQPSALYPVLLLRLLPGLPAVLLPSLVAEPCFLWLCVSAHKHFLSLCAPLPSLPPLLYQPLDVQFIRDSSSALQKLIHLASRSQLKGLLTQCHRQLQPLITAKLNMRAPQ